MVQVIPYLSVPNSLKAVEAYKEVFGATLIERVSFDKEIGMQMGMPEDHDWENSTMHCEIDVHGARIYMADGKTTPGGNVDVLLNLDSKEQIEEVWSKVKAKEYKVLMEMEVQFWGAMFGRFIDEFGVGWQLNYTVPQ
jgi:PhnB protein